ncbi:MAG TPA: YgdI/YgdR family lipoprotein [Verrucomicrobiae bacterium]|nr:YgdI/YgdR family lipoprotein [Verrucomicrobiae bacterium]
MKTIIFLMLVSLMATGCARRYTMTTNGGGQIVSKGRPQLSNGVYVYKDLQGRRATVPAGRIREVAPSSMVTTPRDGMGR